MSRIVVQYSLLPTIKCR